MLYALNVRNYTLIEALDLEFESGMTTITGETGAGKSIVLDALGLTLGSRADAKAIRVGEDRLEVSASFDLGDCPAAADWLREREFDMDGECQLRRSVSRDGRSRAWINGRTATLADLKALGDLLVDLHGQHEHHSLLQRVTQQLLLDEFGGHTPVAEQVRRAYSAWKSAGLKLEALQAASQERSERQQLLRYQLSELEELGLRTGEVETLEKEQKLLAGADETSAGLTEVLALIEGDGADLISLLRHAHTTLVQLDALGDAASDCRDMLESARIQLDEARRELVRLQSSVEHDPERLAMVDARLSEAFQLSRKHRVTAYELPALRETLRLELESLTHSDETLVSLEATVANCLEAWRESAEELSKARLKAAKTLAKGVKERLATLGMEHCRLEVSLTPLPAPSAGGAEQVEFLVSTNPGSAPDSLSKVASGGELSRISLAIQVITAGKGSTPTIIFDEVDVGIGGATADAVGDMLQRLGKRCQVICVTHLPQVASRGDRQLLASKSASKNTANASLTALSEDERVEEIARMLGTRKLTETTLQHAREMLAAASAAKEPA